MSFRDLLADALTKVLQPALASPPRTIFCDRHDSGSFQRFAGLARARRELEDGHKRSGGYPPILILGLFPAGVEGNSLQERELAVLLRWPGIVYLPYGFTKEQLIAAARHAIEGAKAPLPRGILPTAGDILRVASEVRHWLENRLRNTEGSLKDFEAAGRGAKSLHESYFSPVSAISDEHRDMLDRLFELEAAAIRLAPETGGLVPIRTAIGRFEISWQDMERARAVLRAETGENKRAERLETTRNGLSQVCEALSAAIKATRKLESELTARQEN